MFPILRSPGSGLYDNLSKYDLPYPEAVFDISYFSANPKPFFDLAADLYPGGGFRPNVVHHMVRLLELRDILLRVYTQNIDGLERMAGVSEERLVEAHGSFFTATCRRCGAGHLLDDVVDSLRRRAVPTCRKTDGCQVGFSLVNPELTKMILVLVHQ